MSFGKKTKTEHSGAKNGGGGYGHREDVKRTSRRLRRQRSKAYTRDGVVIEYDGCPGCGITHAFGDCER